MVNKGKFSRTLISRKKWAQVKAINLLLSISLLILAIGFIIIAKGNYDIKVALKSTNLSVTELSEGITRYTEVKAENDILIAVNDKAILDNSALCNTIADLEAQQDELIKTVEAASTTLTQLEEAEELANKYGYALEHRGVRTDITLEQLKTLEEVCEKNKVDPNLLLGVILTESGGKENAQNPSSTATGYGQLIYSTAKTTWEHDMCKGTYDKSYALDGSLNIEMAATYLGKLIEIKGSEEEALFSYRGLRDTNYVTRILSYKN